MTNYQVIWDKNKVKFEQKIIEALADAWTFNGPLVVTSCAVGDRVVFSWNREMVK